ncbi:MULTISPECIES: TetR/AcrR family transcriptional regulator [unclassified Streptomyces]|uniref:TetR/AcrR family transcriptional regulator n=1 Tax=unclassified Streptomyces TaxID=2593676 RepID=UPI0033EC9364
MARPRSFDEERALDAAMHAFWANGYEATSTQDLCEATGLGRSSIYNTFTSKHDLFRRTLTRYMETMNASQLALLEDTGLAAVDRVRALLDRIIDGEFEHRENGHSMGCLTVNTTVELAGRDPEAARMLERDLAARLTVLRATIRSGQRDGDITSARGADTLAQFVNAVIGGMRVAAQGGADRDTLQGIAETALAALTAP